MGASRVKPLSRRTFLRGMGVSLALPMLDAMVPAFAQSARAAAPQPRMVFLYVPNGVNIAKWMPGGAGNAFELSPTLNALARHRRNLTVLTGLGHPNSQGGHSGADTWLTGADLHGVPGYDYRNSISVDQIAAEAVGRETRIPSLELSSSGGTGKPGHSHTLSFSRDAVPLPAESRPRAVFQRLFVDDTGASRQAQKQRFADDQSILDSVLGQANSLQRKLGPRDKQKMDEYLTSVREVERRVERSESWLDVPKPQVTAHGLQLDAMPDTRGDRQTYFRTMLDLIVLAMQTDTTRVCTFELGREAAGGNYDELGLKANHHELSHHGGDAQMLDGLFKIDRFLLDQLGYFADRLEAAQEGDATMLHRTMVLYGSGMNSGEGGGHSPKNIPTLMLGGRALGLKLGQHLPFGEGRVPMSNLFVTMLQSMSLPVDRFMDSTGTMTGLT